MNAHYHSAGRAEVEKRRKKNNRPSKWKKKESLCGNLDRFDSKHRVNSENFSHQH